MRGRTPPPARSDALPGISLCALGFLHRMRKTTSNERRAVARFLKGSTSGTCITFVLIHQHHQGFVEVGRPSSGFQESYDWRSIYFLLYFVQILFQLLGVQKPSFCNFCRQDVAWKNQSKIESRCCLQLKADLLQTELIHFQGTLGSVAKDLLPSMRARRSAVDGQETPDGDRP